MYQQDIALEDNNDVGKVKQAVRKVLNEFEDDLKEYLSTWRTSFGYVGRTNRKKIAKALEQMIKDCRRELNSEDNQFRISKILSDLSDSRRLLNQNLLKSLLGITKSELDILIVKSEKKLLLLIDDIISQFIKLEKKVNSLTDELKITKNEINNLKIELNSSNDELKIAKSEINNLKIELNSSNNEIERLKEGNIELKKFQITAEKDMKDLKEQMVLLMKESRNDKLTIQEHNNTIQKLVDETFVNELKEIINQKDKKIIVLKEELMLKDKKLEDTMNYKSYLDSLKNKGNSELLEIITEKNEVIQQQKNDFEIEIEKLNDGFNKEYRKKDNDYLNKSNEMVKKFSLKEERIKINFEEEEKKKRKESYQLQKMTYCCSFFKTPMKNPVWFIKENIICEESIAKEKVEKYNYSSYQNVPAQFLIGLENFNKEFGDLIEADRVNQLKN